MEKYHLDKDLKVFGLQVKAFPDGISEAFDEIIKKLPAEDKRLYYGISECKNNEIVYIAAALETFDGEGSKYGFDNFLVQKGEYLTEALDNWRSKTNTINSVFEEMLKHPRADREKPCVEIYKNEVEMVCMIKALEQ